MHLKSRELVSRSKSAVRDSRTCPPAPPRAQYSTSATAARVGLLQDVRCDSRSGTFAGNS